MIVFRVLPDLSLIKPLKSFDQPLLVFLQIRQACLHQCLRDKSRIPQLAPISSTHHHPLGPYPHKVLPLDSVLFVCETLGAFSVCSSDEVEHLRHRAKSLVFRVLVLTHDELVSFGDTGASEGRDGTVFVAR